MYLFVIVSKNDKKIEEKVQKNKVLLELLSAALLVCVYYLPLYYHSANNIVYSYGPSANLIYGITGILICMLAALYIGLSVYYQGGFTYGTWVNSVYCTGKTVNQINTELITADEYSEILLVLPDGKEETLFLDDIGYYADYSVPIPEEPGNIVIEDCEIYGADRVLHYNFSGNETWQRYRPMRNITFKNIKATNVSMPMTLYGTESNKVELTMENIFINMR